MKLNILLDDIDKLVNVPLPDINTEGISINSSHVRKQEVFVAIPGYSVDGHDFIEDAIEAGASVIVGEKNISNLSVPYIQVSNSRLTLAKMACQFYGNPSREKIVIGITGTNGKTTTAFMLKYILEKSGRTCSIFGTVNNVVNGQVLSSQNTTPDALELQRQLALSRDEIVIMEVSSHGLAQYRVEGIEFDYCLFTNLDHDHLDYHHDMDECFSVKARLFDQLKPNGKAIINHYNSWGRKLINRLKVKNKGIFILGNESHHHLRIEQSKSDASALIVEGDQCHELNLKILGYHNILNASMAFLTARKIGLSSSQIIQALALFPGVPGRYEIMRYPNGATIVIDYAHTADAIFHSLQTAREYGANRIIHIFGFRGTRDKAKRVEMVKVSSELSDGTILTMDDLNLESFEEMLVTLKNLHIKYCKKGMVIPDRTLAIQSALQIGKKEDWVIITGKGPESYKQTFVMPTTSDKETVQYIQKEDMEVKDSIS